MLHGCSQVWKADTCDLLGGCRGTMMLSLTLLGGCSRQWCQLLFAARAQPHLHLQCLHCRHIKLLSSRGSCKLRLSSPPECLKESWAGRCQAVWTEAGNMQLHAAGQYKPLGCPPGAPLQSARLDTLQQHVLRP